MLANVYSYRVMVKSVSSCCVRGLDGFSQTPVTIIIIIAQTFGKVKLQRIDRFGYW